MNSCILTAVGVLAIIVNSCVISKIGRRRVFLMTGLSICGVTQIITAAVSHVNPGTVGTGKVSRASKCPIIHSADGLGHCRTVDCLHMRLQRHDSRLCLAIGW